MPSSDSENSENQASYLRRHRSIDNTFAHLPPRTSMLSLSLLLSDGECRPIQPLPPGQSIIIGRTSKSHPDHSLTFQCPVMSKNHAELTWAHHQVYLQDTGSTHGTWLKTASGLQKLVPHQPIKLEHGMEIRFGKVIGTGPMAEREKHYPVEVTVRLVGSGTYGLTAQLLSFETEDEEDEPPIGSSQELALRRHYLSHSHHIDGESWEEDEDEGEAEADEAEDEVDHQESRVTAFEPDEDEEPSVVVDNSYELDIKPVIEPALALADHSSSSTQDSARSSASIEPKDTRGASSCEESELGAKLQEAELSLELEHQEPSLVASSLELDDDGPNPVVDKLDAIPVQAPSITSANSNSTNASPSAGTDTEPERPTMSTGIQTELAVPIQAVSTRTELLLLMPEETQPTSHRPSKRAREEEEDEEENEKEMVSVVKKRRLAGLLPSLKSVAIFALGGVATVAGILACDNI